MASSISSAALFLGLLITVTTFGATFQDNTFADSNGQEYTYSVLGSVGNEDNLPSLTFQSIAGHRLTKRSDEDAKALLKKGAITKKPTQLIKQKPVSLIAKSNSSSGTASHADTTTYTSVSPAHDVVPTSAAPPTSAPVLVSTEPFYAPDDVTLPTNSTENEDHHLYYNSTLLSEAEEATKYWADLSHGSGVEHITHEMLSNSHRRAATVQLKFPFPFYGHSILNVTIATGGFLYLGETVHSWLAATQYIAPLMANFDTSISNTSNIKYINNGTHFIVQWNDVALQDQQPPGNFSFQVTLMKDGDIVFVYKEVPIAIADLPDSKHPVKVGISDAYVIDRTVFFIRRKTIYEYHRADLKKENITNNTAIYFKALPTCVSLTTCDACVSTTIKFDCKWCDAAHRCSDGFDRHRQDWLVRGCDNEHATDLAKCKAIHQSGNATIIQPAAPGDIQKNGQHAGDGSWSKYDKVKAEAEDKGGNHGAKVGLVTILAIVALISGAALWAYYAYRNPQTGAGQFLIKYRPAEWRWRGPADTRYTAASIHM